MCSEGQTPQLSRMSGEWDQSRPVSVLLHTTRAKSECGWTLGYFRSTRPTTREQTSEHSSPPPAPSQTVYEELPLHRSSQYPSPPQYEGQSQTRKEGRLGGSTSSPLHGGKQHLISLPATEKSKRPRKMVKIHKDPTISSRHLSYLTNCAQYAAILLHTCAEQRKRKAPARASGCNATQHCTGGEHLTTLKHSQ